MCELGKNKETAKVCGEGRRRGENLLFVVLLQGREVLASLGELALL